MGVKGLIACICYCLSWDQCSGVFYHFRVNDFQVMKLTASIYLFGSYASILFMGKHDVHTMYSPPNRVSLLQDLSFKKRKKTRTFLALLAKSDLFV